MFKVDIDKLLMNPKEKKPSEWRKQSKLNNNHEFERKYDGSRYLKVDNGLWSKRNCNRKDRFNHLWKELKEVPAVLDMEIYIPEGNVLDLNAKENWKDAKAVVFDILKYKGSDLRTEKLKKRKQKVKEIIEEYNLDNIHPPKTYNSFKEGWSDVEDRELEGLIAKKKDGKYYSNERTSEWIKLKRKLNTDVEIVGHDEGKDTGTFICRTDDDIQVRVNVRSRDVLEEWKKNKWSKAEVSYQQKTDEGKLFQPIFEKFVKQNGGR